MPALSWRIAFGTVDQVVCFVKIFIRLKLSVWWAEKDSNQMRSPEAVAFSVNLVIVFRIPHFRNFFAGKQDDPVLPN